MIAAEYYRVAKRSVLDQGFAQEIEWQAARDPSNVTETEFLREAAWVIYCSGFRELIVRKYFNYISLCFCDWSSAKSILERSRECINSAMHVLANQRKHEAVVSIAGRIDDLTFEAFKEALYTDPVTSLQRLPYIGPITSLHLAKNLGFEVAKPDRHLVRLTTSLGFEDVTSMCQEISAASGDPIQVVDIVLWRYLERIGRRSDIGKSGDCVKVAATRHNSTIRSGPSFQ